MNLWLSLIRPGDWWVLLIATTAVILSFFVFWSDSPAQRAVIRHKGQVIAELPLDKSRRIEIKGALGISIIEILPGKARVATDPGPRQYCVQQGWLTRANAIAICAPNQVSLMLAGAHPVYDSLNY